jgi:CRISPR-associated protein Cmr1
MGSVGFEERPSASQCACDGLFGGGDDVTRNRITATFAVVTPLFLGSADPASTVELRPPSIKGALRFWWRALAWSRHGGDLNGIRKEEQEIFGAAGQDGTASNGATGQASFIVRVRPINVLATISKDEVLRAGASATVGPGMRYFGYGLMAAFGQNQGQLARPCLSAPFQFSIELVSRRPFADSMISALKVMGLLGALGSRSRRGYGSLSLLSLAGDAETWTSPKTKVDYANQLKTLLHHGQVESSEPPYSAFSGLSRIVVATEGSEPLALLDGIGRQMQRYRSWGHNGKVNGEDSERNFQDDHDWFKSKTHFKDTHPRRAIFGLPYNYSKTLGVLSQTADRRASPLLVHIHKLASQNYIAVVSILRADFLPADDKVWIWQDSPKRPNGDPKRIPADQLREPRLDYAVLNGFIDGTNKKTGQPYFPNLMQILP